MPYIPTDEEVISLGFKTGLNAYEEEVLYLAKGPDCFLTLEDDEGWAVVTEWLHDGPHAWVTCGSFADLQFAVGDAFKVLASGRTKSPLNF